MIEGIVQGNAACVTLAITGEEDRQEVDCIIDTGFTDYLALPESIMRVLQATPIGFKFLTMADGSLRRCQTYLVSVTWDEDEKEVEAVVLEDEPLIGLAMMREMHLHIEVTEGGQVLIESL